MAHRGGRGGWGHRGGRGRGRGRGGHGPPDGDGHGGLIHIVSQAARNSVSNSREAMEEATQRVSDAMDHVAGVGRGTLIPHRGRGGRMHMAPHVVLSDSEEPNGPDFGTEEMKETEMAPVPKGSYAAHVLRRIKARTKSRKRIELAGGGGDVEKESVVLQTISDINNPEWRTPGMTSHGDHAVTCTLFYSPSFRQNRLQCLVCSLTVQGVASCVESRILTERRRLCSLLLKSSIIKRCSCRSALTISKWTAYTKQFGIDVYSHALLQPVPSLICLCLSTRSV